jgi:hypothetical protein
MNFQIMGYESLDSTGSGDSPVLGFCEWDSEPMGFFDSREFPDRLSNC